MSRCFLLEKIHLIIALLILIGYIHIPVISLVLSLLSNEHKIRQSSLNLTFNWLSSTFRSSWLGLAFVVDQRVSAFKSPAAHSSACVEHANCAIVGKFLLLKTCTLWLFFSFISLFFCCSCCCSCYFVAGRFSLFTPVSFVCCGCQASHPAGSGLLS